MPCKWEGKYVGFIPTRYPYTYAYDLLRMQRPLQEGNNSRGEMSMYITDYCNSKGYNKELFCQHLADIYIEHELAEQEAGIKRNKLVAAAFTDEYEEKDA